MTTTTQTRPADAQDRPARTQTGMLIIGASQAGVQLAISLRGTGFTESITLLGEEDHRPYQRPALSKEFLQGTVDKENLIFRSAEYWDEHNIELVKNSRIEKIEKNPDGSGVAIATDGEEYPFARLALAVGARARPLEVPGSDLSGVIYLRSADDALSLKGSLDDFTDVVVIGGGFIGLEVACSLHGMGKNATVLEHGPRLIGRAVGEETSEYFYQAHRDRELDIILNSRVESLVDDGSGRVSGVALADGTVVPAQLVIVGIGVIPNTGLAEQMGLETDNGIVVDRYALASDGTTIAVGDVANMPNPLPDAPEGERIRLESVNNAIEHAKVAAYSVSGRREEYAGIPWFWSNQADMKLQIAGLSMGFDSTVVRRDDEKGKFSVLYYREGQIIAADCVNAPLDFMAVRTALAKNQQIPADQAGDMNVMLKSIAVDREDSR
ncbi:MULTISPECIES: NAD(P)/FAD-dependent oxidoreductase [Brevibacterium]|jgi:3-phenylpropionate/trans-cinnamate dioxygenase ferredoxin reductase subunit|uniref:Ferredoxin--NAD(+) reductase n=2 Tax=Brevibacterium TaxID=1696 RepID=A0A0B9AWJ3_BRELN|nr:FAD-dependent oxidoreductase [Brevibacterium linens]KHS53705.1 Ferredoxin--NAD(+) reductase [Brevibacterium linens]HHX47748.1 FAD-dependent oxidoreductase [Brevibacterium sp.]HJE78615.1 FAD-dependent oxidoreductase [Brevibacterium epidermidis]